MKSSVRFIWKDYARHPPLSKKLSVLAGLLSRHGSEPRWCPVQEKCAHCEWCSLRASQHRHYKSRMTLQGRCVRQPWSASRLEVVPSLPDIPDGKFSARMIDQINFERMVTQSLTYAETCQDFSRPAERPAIIAV
jgi:hypothetical protein